MNEIRLFWISLKQNKVCVPNFGGGGFAQNSFPLKILGFKTKAFIIFSLKEDFVCWSRTF